MWTATVIDSDVKPNSEQNFLENKCRLADVDEASGIWDLWSTAAACRYTFTQRSVDAGHLSGLKPGKMRDSARNKW